MARPARDTSFGPAIGVPSRRVAARAWWGYALAVLALAVGGKSADAASGVSVTVVESVSGNSGHKMQYEWVNGATALGYSVVTVDQVALDTNAFFATTDVLVVSSGTIGLTATRVSMIQAFLQQGGSVYLQSEYQASYTTNQAFASIVNAAGGAFTWDATTSGTLAPMTVSGALATQPNAVPALTYFWYGARGTAGAGVTPFLHFGGFDYGWIFQAAAGVGAIATTTDQDWVNQANSPALVENILVALADAATSCNTEFGAGCPGSGGFVPALEVVGCATPGAPIQVAVSQGLGGSSAILIVGTTPTSAPVGGGCTLLVSPALLVGPLPLGGAAPGAGGTTIPAVIPPAAPPVVIHLQAFVIDPATPIGFAATAGVHMPIS